MKEKIIIKGHLFAFPKIAVPVRNSQTIGNITSLHI